MKLVILDRDGTINYDRDDYVKSADEWLPLPGALEAIARLNQAGWRVAVASNQSGVGRGLYGVTELNAMHAKMNRLLGELGGRVDSVFFCPHTPKDACACRKPLPGLFEQIGERYGINLRDVPSVGDTLRDAQAGAAAGCPTHIVRTGKSADAGSAEGAIGVPTDLPPGTLVHADLGAFVDHLLAV